MIWLYAARIPHPDTRQICSRAAHALLRFAVRERGMDSEALTICRTLEGKPYFAQGTVEFSLSHSGEWAVCALSDGAVGVDVERIRPVSTRLWAKYLANSPDEPYKGDREAILRWTRYEALLKREGKAAKDPSAVYFTDASIQGYLLTVCGDGDVSPIRWVDYDELGIE